MNRHRATHIRARGAAVVLAMLLAALAATIAATLFADQQRWSRAVLHRRDQVQAQALAMAGVQWARQIVHENARAGQTDLGEPWALTLPPVPLENGEIRGTITDAQGRLNVNALGEAPQSNSVVRNRFARLFAQQGGPAAALDKIADWIDADGIARANGAEDPGYATMTPPGLAANAPIVRIGELAAVIGVSAPSLRAIAPYVTALPPAASLNVNTAPPQVLDAIVDGLGSDGLAALVAERKRKPFSTVAEFRARLPASASAPGIESLGVRSDYFLVDIVARQGTTKARAQALIFRGASGVERPWPEIVWQSVE